MAATLWSKVQSQAFFSGHPHSVYARTPGEMIALLSIAPRW